jgi:hypothetical protein
MIIDGGFAIYTTHEYTLLDNTRERFEHGDTDWLEKNLVDQDGNLTDKAWDILNEDDVRIERNVITWLQDTFYNARDEGHGGYGGEERIGTLWVDTDDTKQTGLIWDEDGDKFDDPWYDHDFDKEVWDRWYEGTSDLTKSVLDVQLDFFSFAEDLNDLEDEGE